MNTLVRKLKESAVGIAFACLLLHAGTTTAFADGGYVAENAIQKLPRIPSQRALLSWENGTETLLIASALDSDAQRLGWLIPLPSVPTEIAKADPGALKTLAFCIQPRLTHDLRPLAHMLTIVIVWGLLLATILAFNRSWLTPFLIITFIFVVLASMMLPALGTAQTAASVSSVRVDKTATVGAYDISVLTVGGNKDLNGWLTKNGFTPLPAAAEPVVADYVRRGWKFVAIKLTRAEPGLNTPHPIKLVFPSSEAVYPWQLTTLAGGKPLLELFVVGQTRAAVNGLTTDFCQRLSNGAWHGTPVFEAGETGTEIGHTELTPLLWDGCVLTKLSGRIDSRQQIADLSVRWVDFTPYQQHLYTTTGAGYIAWIVFISTLSVPLIGRLFLYAGGRRGNLSETFFRLLFASSFAAALTYVCLPKLPKADTQISRYGLRMHHLVSNLLHSYIEFAIEQTPADLRQKDAPTIAKEILDHMPRPKDQPHPLNSLMGGELEVESSPGNFTVEKRDGQIVVRVYDETGSPTEVEY
ncbi:MAG TPA: DUF2330 domain-containing protein [Verrucomicrobiae bacterium]|nr:DUF2330 domain-containing protein [Verrucomicrobiae bacterium]